MWPGVCDGIRPKQMPSNTKKLFLALKNVDFTFTSTGDKILVYRSIQAELI